MPIILVTWEAEIERIAIRNQPPQKVHKPHLNQWLGKVAYTCHPSYTGSINRRTAV
jgi:hypothetical protein